MLKATAFSKELNIHFKNEKVKLPEDYINKVQDYWNSLEKEGKMLFNGELFGIASIEEDENSLNLHVKKSDYAHYLYSYKEKENIECNIQVAYTVSVVESSDDYYVMGVMSEATSSPLELQFAGGALHVEYLSEGGKVDVDDNMKSELFEELGIDADCNERVRAVEPYLLIGDKETLRIAIAHRIIMKETKEQIKETFDKYKKELVEKGEMLEICDLKFLKKDKKIVQEFLERDNQKRNDALERVLQIFAYDEDVHKNFL